jgi:hypothetical protein
MNIRMAEIADSEGIAKVHVDSWHETYSGLICHDYLNSLSYIEKNEKWKEIIQDATQLKIALVIENELKI